MKTEQKEIKEEQKEDYLPFGWKIKDVYSKKVGRSCRRTIIVVERDLNQPNHSELVALQEKYMNLKVQLRTYIEMDELLTILLYLLFLIPGILYTIYKANQKKEIRTNNYLLHQQMEKLKAKAKEIQNTETEMS